MSAEITLTLSDDVLRQAERLAERTGRPVSELLAETIELSLNPLGAGETTPWVDLCDEDVLAATELELPDMQDRRLSELLDRQQAGLLTEVERTELATLMHLYQHGLLRKAEALQEAVRRRLREPLSR